MKIAIGVDKDVLGAVGKDVRARTLRSVAAGANPPVVARPVDRSRRGGRADAHAEGQAQENTQLRHASILAWRCLPVKYSASGRTPVYPAPKQGKSGVRPFGTLFRGARRQSS